jgi:hypothetical protein
MGRQKGARPDSWQPLQKAVYKTEKGREYALQQGLQLWMNNRYTVAVRPLDKELGLAGPVHLSIKRNDRAAVRDWRIMQRIKNELVGPEREAYELYPCESKLVDESNQYHLWVMPEGKLLPYGFNVRQVGSPDAAKEIGALQRPFDEDPEDLDAHSDAETTDLRKIAT